MKNYTNNKGTIVGELGDDKIYRSHRHSSKHLLNILDAWGVDKKILDKLKADGCIELRILDHDDMVVYKVSIDTFLEKGIEKNFAYGRQIFLPRKWWVTKEIDV